MEYLTAQETQLNSAKEAASPKKRVSVETQNTLLNWGDMVEDEEEAETEDKTVEQRAKEYCAIELHGYLEGVNKKRLDFQDSE